MHRQAAPQPHKKKDRHTSISSDKSTDSASSCTSTVPGKNCELPKLCQESKLPLGYWDGLYYALVAEIRQLHSDLQEKFGWAIEQGVNPLHAEGTDGVQKEPVTPIDLASILESAWYILMDSRLVAALDDAVRMRKIRENAAKKHNSANTMFSDDDGNDHDGTVATVDYERPPIVDGLVDVNGLSAEDIVKMLWETHAPEIDQASSENFEDESMHTAYQAELHAQIIAQTRALDADIPTSSTCRCRGRCICLLRCAVHASHCTCMPKAPVVQQIRSTGETEAETASQYVKRDMTQKSTSMAALMGPIKRKQSKSQFTSNSVAAAQMPYHAVTSLTQDDKPQRELPSRYRNRQRTNTSNSELAYVPDSKPYRSKGKDAYPLGFYTDGSPGRYPKLRKESSTTSHEGYVTADSSEPRRIPARKPVPTPLLPTQPYIAPGTDYGVVTPPPDGRYTSQAFHAAQAAHHENERLRQVPAQQHDAFTQSFPVTSGNPRKAATSDPFVEPANLINPANEYVNLLGHHPSSFEETGTSAEPVPTLTRAVATTPPRVPKSSKASASTTHLPTLKSFSLNTSKPVPPLPPLPPPDFIAPRPATVQRYVSAGGDAPLSKRAEIAGPAFHSTGFNTPINQSSGAGISKAELDMKMSDPEWVKAHFGAAAAERVSLTPPKKLRGSGDSAAVTDSQRDSRETGTRPSADRTRVSVDRTRPRDRTSSGVSSGVAKIKRVFSRKNTEGDFD